MLSAMTAPSTWHITATTVIGMTMNYSRGFLAVAEKTYSNPLILQGHSSICKIGRPQTGGKSERLALLSRGPDWHSVCLILCCWRVGKGLWPGTIGQTLVMIVFIAERWQII